jgi:hypothetical protein
LRKPIARDGVGGVELDVLLDPLEVGSDVLHEAIIGASRLLFPVINSG